MEVGLRLALVLMGALACLALPAPTALAEVTTVVLREDFDGDGKADTVETARIADILDSLVPGASYSLKVSRERREFDKIGDQTAIVVRLAADASRLYLLMSSSRAAVAACDIRTNPPGEYAADNANGREVLVVKTNVIAISCLEAGGPGTLLKYWSPENGGGFPAAWLPN
jgi:hypothetical protein